MLRRAIPTSIRCQKVRINVRVGSPMGYSLGCWGLVKPLRRLISVLHPWTFLRWEIPSGTVWEKTPEESDNSSTPRENRSKSVKPSRNNHPFCQESHRYSCSGMWDSGLVYLGVGIFPSRSGYSCSTLIICPLCAFYPV